MHLLNNNKTDYKIVITIFIKKNHAHYTYLLFINTYKNYKYL